ncbi:MAG: signal peptidase I [Patescibacteria group bacterium]
MSRFILLFKIILLALVLSVTIRYIAIQPFFVPDNTMAPDFYKGDVVLINRWGVYERNTVVLIRDLEAGDHILRRILALPGERIRVNDGIISIVQEEGIMATELPIFGTTILTLPGVGKIDSHEFFFMPDQVIKDGSGLVDVRHIIGTPMIRIYPFSRIKIFNK